jgi:hypothetical protein
MTCTTTHYLALQPNLELKTRPKELSPVRYQTTRPYIGVEKSAKMTSRLSPVSYCPRQIFTQKANLALS